MANLRPKSIIKYIRFVRENNGRINSIQLNDTETCSECVIEMTPYVQNQAYNLFVIIRIETQQLATVSSTFVINFKINFYFIYKQAFAFLLNLMRNSIIFRGMKLENETVNMRQICF